mmetsp:Transcript_13/g.23  ORF Transcript_13/g.23 Transcript_13/m.23 type:complete len:243 (-) Transcript_13:86-814(-)
MLGSMAVTTTTTTTGTGHDALAVLIVLRRKLEHKHGAIGGVVSDRCPHARQLGVKERGAVLPRLVPVVDEEAEENVLKSCTCRHACCHFAKVHDGCARPVPLTVALDAVRGGAPVHAHVPSSATGADVQGEVLGSALQTCARHDWAERGLASQECDAVVHRRCALLGAHRAHGRAPATRARRPNVVLITVVPAGETGSASLQGGDEGGRVCSCAGEELRCEGIRETRVRERVGGVGERGDCN